VLFDYIFIIDHFSGITEVKIIVRN